MLRRPLSNPGSVSFFVAALLIVAWGLLAPPDARAQQTEAEAPPNIIVVFIDDMGYGDLGVYGNPHAQTPNIDRLAAEGTRFTQFYTNAPICSPSRVAITTGMYPARWRIHSFLNSRERNAAREMDDYLDPAAPTLARTLQAAGYATAHFGKWHMGGGRDVGDAPLPTEYGFDESLVTFEGLGDRYLWMMTMARQSAELGRGRIEWTEKHEMTRIYVDHAIDFMRRHREGPFYLNVWPNDVHDPFVPSPRPGLMEKYVDIARHEQEQQFFAVLDEMDRQLGRLFAAIDSLGLGEETLVILTSDNGPTDWPRYYEAGVLPPGSSGPFRGRKWSLYEGGIRMPFIARWPGHTPAGRVDSLSVFAAFDLFPSLARLAGASLPDEHELDGTDVRPVLSGEPASHEGPLFWFYPYDLKPGDSTSVTPPLAVRDGRWKLLVQKDGTEPQLYDLQTDVDESDNLANEHPDVVARLTEQVLQWHATLPKPLP